ncbi:MAG: DNA replication and repair protein RecF [Chlorobium phaeobacteroides]|nr:DNA replication and repair protein RecF [Chlorobium phaeobacteroides]
MRLTRITYNNFRNYRKMTFEPNEGITLLYGSNGSGKTNILEGIHYCALTKGFTSIVDSDCIFDSSDYYALQSTCLGENGSDIEVRISFSREKGKTLFVNNNEIKKFSNHVGTIPCITFSPPEISIVSGSPSERRKFIDNIICQSDKKYLKDLLTYRRVLLQRNALLAQISEKKSSINMLPYWSENLSVLAASIVFKRLEFLDKFIENFRDLFKKLSINEEPGIVYRSVLGRYDNIRNIDELAALYYRKYDDNLRYELLRSQTSCGPHRDDLEFYINDKEIKKYASQGQLRTFLIGLKLAVYDYLFDTTHEKPICLLDDIFSELDTQRTENILSILQTLGQSIITSTVRRDSDIISSVSVHDLIND